MRVVQLEGHRVAPKKGAPSWRGQFVYVYYGIDPKTLTIKAVGQTRDGSLKARDGNTGGSTHSVTPGRIGMIEVTIAFGLVDVIAIPGNLAASDNPALKRLEEKAAAMRSARL